MLQNRKMMKSHKPKTDSNVWTETFTTPMPYATRAVFTTHWHLRMRLRRIQTRKI